MQPYTPPPQPVVPPTPVCSINQQLVNNICVCQASFYVIKGVCTYCATPNYYDPQNAICRPNCTANQQLDLSSLKCVCITGFYNINGQCGSCPAYSVYSAATSNCQCINGYSFNSGYCLPIATAPQQPQPLPVPASKCSDPNAFYQAPNCVCITNYHLIAGVCQQCPATTFFDPNLNICRIACNANAIYNIVTGQCGCAPSYYLINGTCTQCQGNSTYSVQSNSCTCPSGYRLQGAGLCVTGCGVNEVLNNGQCCCITNFYPVNGICGQCDWNQVYDQGLGICRVPCGSQYIYDLSSQSCVCLPQYYTMADGTCGTCPIYSTYSALTQACVCNQGYILNLGLCTPSCNAYETYVNGVCQCKQGYYLIGYSCGVCPPTQTYDVTYRICHASCQNN
jgi:proprotein convertase subtilisin/kexin type 5